ncbi:hypothetical protein RvY_15337, partial [Ramazzottius varieornatus]
SRADSSVEVDSSAVSPVEIGAETATAAATSTRPEEETGTEATTEVDRPADKDKVSTRECRAEVDLALRKPAKRLDVEAASSASEEFRKLEISKGYGISNQFFWLQETQSGNKSEGGNQQTEAKPGYHTDQLFDNTSCDAIEKEQQNKQREQ